MRCIDHKQYKGVNKPRAVCLGCWLIWLSKHPDASLEGKDLFRILSSTANKIGNLEDDVAGAATSRLGLLQCIRELQGDPWV